MRHSRLRSACCAGAAVGLLSAVAMASDIATGPSSASDGFLRVGLDEFGSWASAGFGGTGDTFNPAGPLTAQEATFTSGFLFFSGIQRELLSTSADWQAGLPADASLSTSITAPNSASDTNADGVNDTLTSGFRLFGGTTDLAFSLTQRVQTAGPGVSFLSQEYVVTNNGNANISFEMVRALDADLLWSGDFGDDQVGTTMHSNALGPYVFQEEAADAGITAITLSMVQAGNYYGGKHGITPGGAGTPYDFGTDTEVYDAFGVPNNWRNNIAGVGYNLDGVSGPFPPGSSSPEDGFIGLDVAVNRLMPGQSTTISVLHT